VDREVASPISIEQNPLVFEPLPLFFSAHQIATVADGSVGVDDAVPGDVGASTEVGGQGSEGPSHLAGQSGGAQDSTDVAVGRDAAGGHGPDDHEDTLVESMSTIGWVDQGPSGLEECRSVAGFRLADQYEGRRGHW